VQATLNGLDHQAHHIIDATNGVHRRVRDLAAAAEIFSIAKDALCAVHGERA
jgi:hypothetical protein